MTLQELQNSKQSGKRWDRRFINLAEHIAQWSKDPSTQCGAIIARGNRIISLGFNGFPVGIDDSELRLQDRDTKYSYTIHAEINAILFANTNLADCTLYVVPMPPCCRCMTQIIQVGIKRIVTVLPSADALSRWGEEIDKTIYLGREASIIIEYI